MRHPHEIRALLRRFDSVLRPLDLVWTTLRDPKVLYTLGVSEALRWALGAKDEPSSFDGEGVTRSDQTEMLAEVAKELVESNPPEAECAACERAGDVITMALFGRRWTVCRGNSGRARRPCFLEIYKIAGPVCFGCGDPMTKNDRRAGLCASCTAALRKERRGTY